MWESSFVAVTVLLGGSLDDGLNALPESAQHRVALLTKQLRDPKRTIRAQALASIAQDVVRDAAEVTLR